jgi:hypothetical protein
MTHALTFLGGVLLGLYGGLWLTNRIFPQSTTLGGVTTTIEFPNA